jgi:hypothetical protein
MGGCADRGIGQDTIAIPGKRLLGSLRWRSASIIRHSGEILRIISFRQHCKIGWTEFPLLDDSSVAEHQVRNTKMVQDGIAERGLSSDLERHVLADFGGREPKKFLASSQKGADNALFNLTVGQILPVPP